MTRTRVSGMLFFSSERGIAPECRSLAVKFHLGKRLNLEHRARAAYCELLVEVHVSFFARSS